MAMDHHRTVAHRRVKLVLICVTVGLVAAILAQAVFGGARRVQIGTGSVAALSRGVRAADALPADILGLPFAAHNFASPDGAGSRLLKTDGSLQIFAVPGKARLLCIIEVDNAAETSGGTCADRKLLLTGSIWTADIREDGTKDIVGLVGDGHTYAEASGRRVPVENNAFVLRGVEGNELTVGSPTAAQSIKIAG
jgi:hypothetical protein